MSDEEITSKTVFNESQLHLARIRRCATWPGLNIIRIMKYMSEEKKNERKKQPDSFSTYSTVVEVPFIFIYSYPHIFYYICVCLLLLHSVLMLRFNEESHSCLYAYALLVSFGRLAHKLYAPVSFALSVSLFSSAESPNRQRIHRCARRATDFLSILLSLFLSFSSFSTVFKKNSNNNNNRTKTRRRRKKP